MISFFIFCIGMHLNRVEICNTDKSSRYALGVGIMYYITLKKLSYTMHVQVFFNITFE